MRYIFPWLWLLLFVVGLFFLARIACALFSEKTANEIRRHPIRHALWALPGIFSALVLLLFVNPQLINIWPPHWLELKHQREAVRERVQAAGGWEKLRQDCLTFANTNQDERVFWIRWNTNHVALPPALAALNPQQIEYYSTNFHTVPNWRPGNELEISVIHIKVFGMHSTGGHDTPYYGLDVLRGPEPNDYQPKSPQSASGRPYFKYRKITDGIYEVY